MSFDSSSKCRFYVFIISYQLKLLGLDDRPALDQNLYYTGMKYTTATFASAMTNMVPGLVFLMAWLVR